MAFIAAKKIARSDTNAALDLLRMVRRARDRIHLHRSGAPVAWGAGPTPHDPLPPTDPPAQPHYLTNLIADLAALQPTTDAAGGLVTPAAVPATNAFVERISQELQT